MNPDLLSAVVAYLRTKSAIVSAFGDSSTSIKFWSDYAGPSLEAMPFLVLTEPSSQLTFETASDTGDIGPMRDGIVSAEVYAHTKTLVRSLSEQITDALTDPELSIANTGVIYFRPTGNAFPVLTQSGPDGQPTIFARTVQFRFMTEPTD